MTVVHTQSVVGSSRIRIPFAVSAALTACLCLTDSAWGQSFTWSGAGGNSSWSTAGNWLGGVAPTPSSTLEIVLPNPPTSGTYVMNSGTVPWTLNRLTISNGNYFTSWTNGGFRFSGTNSTYLWNGTTDQQLSNTPAIDLATDLTFSNAGSSNFGFANRITGLGGFTAIGGVSGSRLTHFYGANTYAGTTNIRTSTVLQNTGRITNTASLNIFVDAATQRNRLDISAGSFSNRVADTVSVNLQGGYLRNFTGDETLGRTTFQQGWSGIYSLTSTNILRLSSLERANRATGIVAGFNLGGSGSAAGGRVLVNGADAAGRTISSQLVGGGGAPGSTTVSVLPWLVSGSSFAAGTLVTYDATAGFRPLNLTTEFVNNPSNWSMVSPNDNVRTFFSGTTTLTADASINSLVFGDGNTLAMTLNGTGKLTVNSGGILYLNNATGATLGISQLDFAGREGVFTQLTNGGGGGSSLTITGVISNADAVTFAGNSDNTTNISNFIVSGASTYTGPTTVNSSMLAIANSDNRLPTTTVLNVANLATFSLSNASSVAGFNQTVAGLQGQGTVTNTGTSQRTLTISTTNAADDFTFNGALTGGTNFALALTGPGRQTLAGTSTYAGPTSIGAGTLRIAGAGQLGSGTYAGAIANAGTLIFSSSASQLLTGVISGAGSLVQSGVGTLTLAAANTYSGSTALQAAPLVLDFSAASSPASNILSSSSALSMQGSTLQLVGKASTTNAQTVNGLAITGGASLVTLSANATSNPLSLSVGAITRSTGATLNITNPAGTIGSANGFITSSGNTSGIIGGWATVGNADWAVANASSGVTALAAYTNDTWADGNNTTVTTNSSPASDSTTNSLRFNNAGATTVALTGVNTDRKSVV